MVRMLHVYSPEILFSANESLNCRMIIFGGVVCFDLAVDGCFQLFVSCVVCILSIEGTRGCLVDLSS